MLNTLSVVPFFLICPHLFISLPAYASYIKNRSVSFFELKITEWVKIQYITCIMIIVFTVTVFRRNLEEERKRLIHEILKSFEGELNMTIEWKVCLFKISDKNLFHFSVLSLFPINFILILSYTSALINFSILFINLEN